MDAPRVLVIDDSTTLRKLVEIAMRGTGCTVDFAANGSDGVSRARANRPDVVLLDYLLPDLRSAEVCQRLHDDAATSRIPVVIMSANQSSVLDDFRMFSSVVGFIGKPFTAPEIRSRLEGVVRRADRLSGGAAPVNAHPPLAAASTVDDTHEAHAALQLRGDLVATPLLDVLRLLTASHATGTLVIEVASHSEPVARIWLRRGAIVLCAGPDDASARALTPELRDRVARNLAAGKPALVTLAEAGALHAANLPLELHAASVRVLGDVLDARSGRFAWHPAAALPDFVDAFGRQLSLTAVALDHGRRAAAAPPGMLEHAYDRTPKFSDKLAGARLTGDEQRVLAFLDGQATGRDIVARAKLPADQAAAILSRLSAADLIHQVAPRTARMLAVHGEDGELVAALRARLSRTTPPIEVIELDPHRSLAAAILEARPLAVMVSAGALTPHVLEHELPIIARDSTTAIICVLDSSDPQLAARMLRGGLHAVLAKPIHVSEIERVLSR
jgi:DNA-binding response OmpR family regulator